MDAYLIIGKRIDLSKYKFDNNLVIGIDKGAYLAYKAGIKLDYAVGDFDSISIDMYNELLDKTRVIKLNPIKDETDTLYAINMCKECETIYILGGISGDRIDHFVANLKLFYRYNNLVFIDDKTFIKQCDMKEDFQKDEYYYYSFFALEDVSGLSLNGFKYSLNDYNLSHMSSLGISNEILKDSASLTYSSGKLLLIKTKKDEEVRDEK